MTSKDNTGNFDIVVSDDLNYGFIPLTLDTELSNQAFAEDDLDLFYVSLNPGKYLILTEISSSDVDMIIEVATDYNFDSTLQSANYFGTEGFERCIVELSAPKTIYIRVTGGTYQHYSIVVTSDINEGFTPLELDYQLGSPRLDQNEYTVYAIDLSAGTFEFKVATDDEMDLHVLVYDDPLLQSEPIRDIDDSAYSADEIFGIIVHQNTTIYVKVISKAGDGYFTILVTKSASNSISSSTSPTSTTSSDSFPPGDDGSNQFQNLLAEILEYFPLFLVLLIGIILIITLNFFWKRRPAVPSEPLVKVSPPSPPTIAQEVTSRVEKVEFRPTAVEDQIDDLLEETIGTVQARITFFCQLDSEQHPATDSAYQCKECSRMICDDCYEKSREVGVVECPFCRGKFQKIQ